jgi:hypothetical protein
MARTKATAFSQTVVFKAPQNLTHAIELQASRQMTSTSEYVRRAVLQRLENEGVSVMPTETRAA